MAIIKQGGARSENSPLRGQVLTTMGLRGHRPPLCMACGQRKPNQIYTQNANGQVVCADCASPRDRELLTYCDSESCGCGKHPVDGPDPA